MYDRNCIRQLGSTLDDMQNIAQKLDTLDTKSSHLERSPLPSGQNSDEMK